MIKSSNVTGDVYPLVLHYSNPGREWKLLIKSFPEKQIILDGVYPTRDEIISCLERTSCPIWMISVVEVLASIARRDDNGPIS